MANYNIADFKSQKNSLYNDNTAGEISAGDGRDALENVADSFVNAKSTIETLSDGASGWDLEGFQKVTAYISQSSASLTLALSNAATQGEYTLLLKKDLAGALTVNISLSGSTTRAVNSNVLKGGDGDFYVIKVYRRTGEIYVVVLNDLELITGELANLTTTDKTSLVAAINEVRASLAGFGNLSDTDIDTLAEIDAIISDLNLTGLVSAVAAQADTNSDVYGKINMYMEPGATTRLVVNTANSTDLDIDFTHGGARVHFKGQWYTLSDQSFDFDSSGDWTGTDNYIYGGFTLKSDGSSEVFYDISAVEVSDTFDTVYLLFIYDIDNERLYYPNSDIRALIGGKGERVAYSVAVSDETTALTTGTAKITFRMPFAMALQEVRASVVTAPTDATIIVDINEDGSTVLSTKLSIDATEKTSTTAATPAVISDSSLADDAEMTIDIDQVGSTVAGAGLKVTLIGYRL